MSVEEESTYAHVVKPITIYPDTKTGVTASKS
jgi:hypothetical protein